MYKKHIKKIEFMRDKLNKKLSNKNTNSYNHEITTLIIGIDNLLYKINNKKEVSELINEISIIEKQYRVIYNLNINEIMNKDINTDIERYAETIKTIKSKEKKVPIIKNKSKYKQSLNKTDSIKIINQDNISFSKKHKEQLDNKEKENNKKILLHKNHVIECKPIKEGFDKDYKNNKFYDFIDKILIRKNFLKLIPISIMFYFLGLKVLLGLMYINIDTQNIIIYFVDNNILLFIFIVVLYLYIIFFKNHAYNFNYYFYKFNNIYLKEKKEKLDKDIKYIQIELSFWENKLIFHLKRKYIIASQK